MNILGLSITRAAHTKAASPAGLQQALMPVGRSGLGWPGAWWPYIRESFAGAWQQNVYLRADQVLAYFAVYACVTLIAGDIGKLCLRLVEEIDDDIWEETSSPAFSPVLRKPNHYQNIGKFIEQWIISKLVWGNAYVLKQYDARQIVTALYVLNPALVRPMIAPDGSIYYNVAADYLSEVPDALVVPAADIIHDPMIALFHPLVGVSPIFACGLAASQGLAMQNNSTQFFSNGSQPGGMLLAPGAIADDTAKRLSQYWHDNFGGSANVGKVAVLGDGLKYEPMTMSAVDAQLIDQLKWTAENVCSCYHVPPWMIGAAPAPPYANSEPLVQLYYSQCLQTLITSLETALDEGLGILAPMSDGTQYGTEFDIDDLIWMDTKTRAEAAAKAAGTLSPNEARAKYYGAGKVTGGDSPMVQQQYYSLDALAKRDAADPFAKPAPATPPDMPPAEPPPPDDTMKAAALARLADVMRQKGRERFRAA